MLCNVTRFNIVTKGKQFYYIFGEILFQMENIIPFSITDLAKVTNHRSGEVKFGEKMLTIPKGENYHDYLKNCEAQYVLFGIPEDVGIRANFGRPGANSAWKSAIASIANIQHNRFCKGSQILVLGSLDVTE